MDDVCLFLLIGDLGTRNLEWCLRSGFVTCEVLDIALLLLFPSVSDFVPLASPSSRIY
jgi:hypothetical protein